MTNKKVIEMHDHIKSLNLLHAARMLDLHPPIVRGTENKTFPNLSFPFPKENVISDFFINEAKENRKTLQKIKARIRIPREKESNILVRVINDKFSLLYSAEKTITERNIEEFIKNLPEDEK